MYKGDGLTLLIDLADLIEQTYAETWNSFAHVKANARIFGLKKKTVDAWKTPGEPAFVAHLATKPFAHRSLSKILEKRLSPKISKGTPLVSGVFIHQKPKVSFGNPASEIEIGDILFVRHHFQSKATSPEGRAFLLQAKSTTKPKTGKLEDKEAQQFDLYANWNTDFTFPNRDIGNPPDGAKEWNLSKGPQPYVDTGFYGLVSNDKSFVKQGFPDASPWAVGGAFAPAAGIGKEVTASGSLARALESFIMGSHGRPWTLNAPVTDHWSHFVEEILQNSLAWRTKVQRIQEVNMPRQTSALALVTAFAQLNFETALESNDSRSARAFEAQINAFRAIKDQGKNWIADGGSDETYSGGIPANYYEDRRREPTGGMSVLYIATFGEGPLEPPREYSESRPRPS